VRCHFGGGGCDPWSLTQPDFLENSPHVIFSAGLKTGLRKEKGRIVIEEEILIKSTVLSPDFLRYFG
jgi:hypothetical protein